MKHFWRTLSRIVLLLFYVGCGRMHVEPMPVEKARIRKSEPVVKVEIVPMRIIGFAVYTAELQDFSEIRHDGVFATVYCSVHGGYAPYSDYKTEHPLETADETFAGYPIYTDGDTISVKMTEHRPADLEGVKALATIHAEVVSIGFCKQGTYRLNINGFEKTFRVGNIMPMNRSRAHKG